MGPEGGSKGAATEAARRSVFPALAWAARLCVARELFLAAFLPLRDWVRGCLREARMFRRAPLATILAWAAAMAARLGALLTVEVDQRRHWLLLPVFLGCGILWFFSRAGPGEALAPLIAAGALLVAAATRSAPALRLALVALAMVPAGYAAGALRISFLAAPSLQRVMSGELVGYVLSVDQHRNGLRLVIAVQSFADLRPNQLPTRVRVNLRQAAPLVAGVTIQARARLLPPPEAARPGGYDFARDAWFREIGASGSISGRLAVLDGAGAMTPDWSMRLMAWIDNGRMQLTDRIAGAWGGQAGAVAAALVTGKRGQITGQTNSWLRAAGIYHIISISGLHMVLAAGMFFWTIRALLSLSAWCALHLPVRKIAAALAILGAVAYCIFTGADVATVRSLIMTVALLGAILVDRPALSMHNLALAALIVLAREPESILGPSFQMSFAAVAGLIVLAGRETAIPGRAHERRPQPGPAMRVVAPLISVIAATLVCEMATGPFSVWHFQSIYPLGIVGNAMALPFLSLVVMPAAVIGVALAPFGLDWPVWWVMGAATEPIMFVSAKISETPYSVAGIAAPGVGALACLSLAITWFVIWRTRLRWLAAVPALAGLLLLQTVRIADVFVDRSGRGALVVMGEGRDAAGELRLTLLGTPSPFVVEQWLRSIGDQRAASDPGLRTGASCDPLACIAVRDDSGAVVWIRERRAFFEDCGRADVVISQHRAPPDCHPPVLLDRAALERQGAASVRLHEGVARVRRARVVDDAWPWTRIVQQPARYMTRTPVGPAPNIPGSNVSRTRAGQTGAPEADAQEQGGRQDDMPIQ